MALNGNQTLSERELYVGYAVMNVRAFNPTLSELINLGITPKKEEEPVYWIDKNQSTLVKVLVDCALPNNTIIKTDIPFFISPAEVSQTGKMQFVDKFGRFKWIDVDLDTKQPDYNLHTKTQYFDYSDIRIAYRGEEELTEFLKNWLNVKKDQEFRLDTIENIYLNQNLEEINNQLRLYPNNKIGVLLGVKEGKYQIVYTRKFERSWATDCKNILKSLAQNANYIQGFFGNESLYVCKQDAVGNNIPVSIKLTKFNDSMIVSQVTSDNLPF